MFMSKIRSAATAAGVAVAMVRSHEAALTAVRNEPPSLILLDLNNPRTDPMGLVASWKAAAETRLIPVVGYVSHVQTDVIQAARTAGIDEVLARSAFVQQLPELLARGRQGPVSSAS